jgi:hypothetical protein
VFLVFEYCPHDMGKLVDSMPQPFHESEVKCLMTQVGVVGARVGWGRGRREMWKWGTGGRERKGWGWD